MRKEKPSRTAYKVALNILALDQEPRVQDVLPEGIIDATAQVLIASGTASQRLVRWHRTAKMTAVYRAFDWMLPGQFEAFAHRKAFCEQQVRDGIAAGTKQVLVLGAGYDTLGWRLAPQFPDVHFFEIDQPATAGLKQQAIVKMGQYDNLHIIPEDLGKQKLVDVLKSCQAWDPQAQTVFIAEGLLMYLPATAVEELFRQCASISGSGSRIAFTYVGKQADGRPDGGPCTGFLLWSLNVAGEPWLWSIQPLQISGILKENGWTYSPELTPKINRWGVEFFGVARRD